MAAPFALIACDVLEKEIAELGRGLEPPVVTTWIRMALHDRPDAMRAVLQEAIAVASAREGVRAVALAFGLCGLGTSGLRAAGVPLVVPRAHDCVTLLLGSKERHAEQQRACPSCYYYTPGWNREGRVPGPDRLAQLEAEFRERFDPDDVAFLLESERRTWAQHDTAVFVDLGTDDAEAAADEARRCAAWLRWRFVRLRGDPALLRALLAGAWDEARFQTVPPGGVLRHTGDAAILRAERLP